MEKTYNNAKREITTSVHRRVIIWKPFMCVWVCICLYVYSCQRCRKSIQMWRNVTWSCENRLLNKWKAEKGVFLSCIQSQGPGSAVVEAALPNPTRERERWTINYKLTGSECVFTAIHRRFRWMGVDLMCVVFVWKVTRAFIASSPLSTTDWRGVVTSLAPPLVWMVGLWLRRRSGNSATS